MLFAYLLIVCSSYAYKTPCLPVQKFYSHETCQRVGNAYNTASRGDTKTICVQIPRKDI